MYSEIKKESVNFDIDNLKKELQALADRDFYHQMKDHWDSEDFTIDTEIHNNINKVIDKLAKLGVKAKYQLGHEIVYSDINVDDQDYLKNHKDEIDKVESNEKELDVYGKPRGVIKVNESDVNISKDELDKAVKEEFINVYGYPKDVSPEFDDNINPDFYTEVKSNVKKRLLDKKVNELKKQETKEYLSNKKELEKLRKNHSTNVDLIDSYWKKIKDYEAKYKVGS